MSLPIFLTTEMKSFSTLASIVANVVLRSRFGKGRSALVGRFNFYVLPFAEILSADNSSEERLQNLVFRRNLRFRMS